MKIKLQKKFLPFIIPFGIVCFAVVFIISCNLPGTNTISGSTGFPDSIVISSVVPADIFSDGTPSSQASLQQAAIFAWKEFIALNWKTKVGYRDSADNSIPFGADAPGIPLVWQSFRHKVEIFPGNGLPPHGFDTSKPHYGYNDTAFRPQYFYNPDSTTTSDGQIPAIPGIFHSGTTPWVNLDETNEIGQANMFAGAVNGAQNQNQILFMAKANRAEYEYAVKTGWYNNNSSFQFAEQATKAYISANQNTPTPSMGDSLISLPYGTIEIKTSWRRLTQKELNSGRFLTDTVRYYVSRNGKAYYNDEVFGMVGLHIIQKTPTAPYFIFATFEQADNLLTTDGLPVEDEDGNIIRNDSLPPLTPVLTVTNATKNGTFMKFSPLKVNAVAGSSLYYQNISTNTLLPQGTIRINKRLNQIPQDIIDVNKKAHTAIKNYGQKKSVWMYYKLINVQYRPIDKPNPGGNYSQPDSATYYLSNSVVESDYVLQRFSGRFDSTLGTITDFTKAGSPVTNVYNGKGNHLMGGCMGCHGNATNLFQTDYSFIFGFPVDEPAIAAPITGLEATRKLVKILGRNAGNK